RHNVVRNNYFHNENWNNGFGDRAVYTGGYAQDSGSNLIEGNRIAFGGTPPDSGNVAAGMGLTTRSNIIRFNCFYGSQGDGMIVATMSGYPDVPVYNRIYCNTFFKNGRQNPSNPGAEMCGLG